MKKIRKMVSAMLAATLLLSMMSIVFAAGSEGQIAEQGETHYYDSSGYEVTSDPSLGRNAVVEVSKTAKPTDTENEFEIELKVRTSVDISEVSVSEDSAVVLLLDNSSSMAFEMEDKTIAMDGLKKAAREFLDDYVDGANGAKRFVSIVVFDTTAEIKSEWIDVTDSNNMREAKRIINAMTPTLATNTEGALILARNLLRKDAVPKDAENNVIQNRNVIVFSDGWATRAANSHTVSYRTGSNVISEDGVWTVYDSMDKAKHMATSVKSSDTFHDFNDGNKPYEKYNANLYAIVMGDLIETSFNPPLNLTDWVKQHMATDPSFVYSYKNSNELSEGFAKVVKRIESWAEAWILTDAMGSNIVFDTVIPPNDINSGVLDFKNNTLTWDLKKDKYDSYENNIYTYNYKYRIKLDTDQPGFSPDKPYSTGSARPELTYVMTRDGLAVSDVMTAKFSNPSVKGLSGSFYFTKVGGTENLSENLSGCEFKLTSKTNPSLSFTAKSGADGRVSFEKLPSGVTYTLEEISIPDSLKGKYEMSSEKYEVKVEEGETTITDGNGDSAEIGFKFVNSFAGRTVTGLVYPGVVNDRGLGIEFLKKHNITVELRPTFNTPASADLSTTAEIDSKSGVGTFTFENVPFGTYVLHIDRPGYLVRSMMVTISPDDPDVVQLKPPGTADRGIFNLWGGDTRGEGFIDNLSLMLIIQYMDLGIDALHPDYNPACDLNADGMIDNLDILIVMENWELSSWDYPGAEDVDFWE